MSAPVIVTGAAGFIGMHLAQALLARGEQVVGLDNLNDYYDPALKQARLAQLQGHPGFAFERVDITDREAFPALLVRLRPARIVHLAAQVGVRCSMTHLHAYIDANLSGFLNVLEVARYLQREGAFTHLAYASSSSVYGANSKTPFSVEDRVDTPVSLYAASKRANELMALVYARQLGVAATGVRFLRYMARGDGPIWQPSNLRVRSWRVSRLMFTATVSCSAISLTSTMPLLVCWPCWIAPRLLWRACLMRSTTSATTSPSPFCALSKYWPGHWAALHR